PPSSASPVFPCTTLFRSGRFRVLHRLAMPFFKRSAFFTPFRRPHIRRSRMPAARGTLLLYLRNLGTPLPTDQHIHLFIRAVVSRSEEHTSELQSRVDLVC